MTVEIDSLPREPSTAWTKPTWVNTKQGKLYAPTHPGLLKVVFIAASPARRGLKDSGDDGPAEVDGNVQEEEEFNSRLIATRDFAPNSIITHLTNLSSAPEKAYSSVQYGPGPHEHLELNSDLLFMNHSCSPSAYLILPARRQSEWVVRAGPDGLRTGDDVTFFYPSTEWDMAQGFDCSCGSSKCLGRIRGAKYLSSVELEAKGYVNEHIRRMKAGQEDASQWGTP